MSYPAFAARLGAINDVLNASSVLTWDSRTMMPAGGSETRGQQVATLTVIARGMLVDDETLRLADAAERAVGNLPEDAPERRALAQTRAAIAVHRRIPEALLQRRAALKPVAQAAWIEARAESRFDRFAPHLEETVELNRRLADAIGWTDHPYDALLLQYEPGETAASLKTLFERLRQGLVPLRRAVAERPAPRADFLERDYPEDRQRAFAERIAARIGYDFTRGRLDSTVHPFEVSFTRNDVRITTRFYRNFLPASLFGALHEAGHGLYEQGVDPAYTRTPLATDLIGLYAVGGTSFGAHESQSRLWENHVGRSRAFWDLHFDELRQTFPDALADVDAAAFHRAVNRVRPGFIRVEADELTYDVHIMLRVEIESELMAGTLKVKDLPERWNATMQRDLGVVVPDDRRGVLQDIHWSSGTIGSFCSYTIGNIMAAQLMAAARAERPDLDTALKAGDYAPLRDWLRDAIHRHGRRYGRDELLVRATGRPLDPGPYLDYLQAKYADLYGLRLA